MRRLDLLMRRHALGATWLDPYQPQGALKPIFRLIRGSSGILLIFVFVYLAIQVLRAFHRAGLCSWSVFAWAVGGIHSSGFPQHFSERCSSWKSCDHERCSVTCTTHIFFVTFWVFEALWMRSGQENRWRTLSMSIFSRFLIDF